MMPRALDKVVQEFVSWLYSSQFDIDRLLEDARFAHLRRVWSA